jgi:hypothetical protein
LEGISGHILNILEALLGNVTVDPESRLLLELVMLPVLGPLSF